ncbi:ribonuclease H-like domain-containing protein [Tanacetum coccineum]
MRYSALYHAILHATPRDDALTYSVSVSTIQSTQNTNPNPVSIHPMVTHCRVGINHPTQRLNIHVSSISPLPKSYSDALVIQISKMLYGTLSRYKARLVANGSTQVDGIDVNETFSPFVKLGMFLSHRKYGAEILERARMANCNLSWTPVDIESKLGDDGDLVSDPTFYQSLTRSLQYLTFIRPDISYVVQQVCLYMHDSREPHFSVLKWILRYVRGTLDRGLQLFSSYTTSLVAYSDADWAGYPTTRKK